MTDKHVKYRFALEFHNFGLKMMATKRALKYYTYGIQLSTDLDATSLLQPARRS